jgi:NAD(P)-dependent dehydrogenase (short-subunit alcohol dehydrogenase family)
LTNGCAGASAGTPFAVARRFLAEGWRVALIDIDVETLAATERGLARPDRVLALPADVAIAAQVATKAVHTPDIRAGYHDAIPLNRYGTEEEIAAGVWFLCSADASYVNGQTLAVDGAFDGPGIGLPSLRLQHRG